jgi:F5/8 type C domain
MLYSILRKLSKVALLLSVVFLSKISFAAITDGKFGINQIFDVQYYWSGNTLNASNFIAPYNKNFQTVTVTTGQYFQFFASTTHPGKYGLKLMNSNGTQHSIVHDHGDVTALGNDAIFYIGSGFFGNVISTSTGYNYGASATFTNMDTSVSSTDLNNYTFASSTPLAAGQTAAPAGPPPPAPTPIYMDNATVKITRAIPTTNNSPSGEGPNNAFDNNPYTKYLNFDKKNAGVTVQLNTGRVVTGFTVTTANDFSGRDPTSYKLYGSNDGVTWTLIKEDTIALSENRYATSAVISVGNTTAYAYYFMLFPTTKAGEGCGLNCDSMQIAELTFYYDANSTTTSTATGNTIVDPVAAASTPVYSSGITASQQTRKNTNLNENPLGHNTQVNILGDDNIVNIQQIGGRHYVSVDVQGNVNNVEILQTSTVNARHYMEARVVGSNNDLILHQRDTSKTQFVEVIGTHNTVTTNQKGTGAHYLDVRVTGDNHSAGIIQDGSGSHRATVHLDGSQPWNFNLNQNSSTGQTYSLPHGMSDGSAVSGTCSAIGGCNLTINQQ